ncbi:AAA family ATPase [Mycolicibacterium sp. Y3]
MKNSSARGALTANGIAAGRDYGNGGEYSGDGPDAIANYISGDQWADVLGVDPDESITAALGVEVAQLVRRFCRRFELPVSYDDGGMTFSDFAAVPSWVWHAEVAGRPKVTRLDRERFTEDTMTRDPDDIGAEMERARQQRYAAQRAVDRAFKGVEVPTRRLFTVNAVERACGTEVADQVRARIHQANRDCWNTPKPHNLHERPQLVTAADLHQVHGVPVATLAAMPAATAEDISAAKQALAVARKRHTDDITVQARTDDHAPLHLDTEVLSFDQLSELEPVTPLISGVLPLGELVEVIGEPGTAKTFIGLGQALAVAAGRDWCGHAVPTAQPVLYVLAEGTSDVEVRAKAYCERHGITAGNLGERFHLYPRPAQIADADHMRDVRDFVEQHGIKLVVFDTKARCTVGVEENSATDQGRAIANVETISRDCGATVVVVHHTGKGADTGRGSTAWLGAVWSSLLVTRGGKGKSKTGAVTITCAKHKGWVDGCTHRFTLEPVTVPETAMAGKTLAQRQSLAVTEVDQLAETAFEAQAENAIGQSIQAVFHTYGATTGLTKAEGRKYARESNVSDSSYTRYFDGFVKSGVLVQIPGKSAHFRLKIDASVSTVGTDENLALVDTLKARMAELRNDGDITDANTKADVEKMLGNPDKTAYAQAWGWFQDNGRPVSV